MSPRSADPTVRPALLDAAARLLAHEGPAALTTRRLATEAGTSTMAVYTRFGSMDEVRRAVRQEGFARLSARLDKLPSTEDPVADLVAAGTTYFVSGLAEPHLYRAMFLDRPLEGDEAGGDVFQRLVAAVRRCVEAGRFEAVEPSMLQVWAAQLWSMRHGMVTLVVTGLLAETDARFVLDDLTLRLLVGYGDEPARAGPSLERGNQASAAPAGCHDVT